MGDAIDVRLDSEAEMEQDAKVTNFLNVKC